MIAAGSGTKEQRKLSATAERFCCRFSLAEIQLATEDFSEEHLIGTGGFGQVYKGKVGDEQLSVAIKRLGTNSNQGEGEFLAEIETLSKLRHVNLVSLIGYCSENGEMILLYEYIARGTLADHLYKLSRNSESDDCSSLTWKQRLNICIGAARGLDYLHTGTSIVHRDVKSTNILLDENFTAKVSDFGLAKHLSPSNSKSHVSTIVKGTFGYLDPSYFTTCRVTRKSDTYAFGVVLLEVLCGRPAVDSMLGEDEMSLAMWAREKISKRKADQIVASNLRDEISADCLKTFVRIATRCLNLEPKKRPTMAQVVAQLELAVEQQQPKAQPLNASRFLLFWNRAKPSGSLQKGHKQGDIHALKDVNILPAAHPAIPKTESGHDSDGDEELNDSSLESMQAGTFDPRSASRFYKDFTLWLNQGVQGTPGALSRFPEEALKDVNMLPRTESGNHQNSYSDEDEEFNANSRERKGQRVKINTPLRMHAGAYSRRPASSFYKDFSVWLNRGVEGTSRSSPTRSTSGASSPYSWSTPDPSDSEDEEADSKHKRR